MPRNNGGLLAIVALVLVTLAAGARSAVAEQVFSFESSLDGFFGLGATASEETSIGVTHGTKSMAFAAGSGGFVGVRTTVIPAAINNPPGVNSIQFDMTVPQIPAGITFADIGITVFGHDVDGGAIDVQSQFTDTISIGALGVGQHENLVIDLDSEFFTGQSFNEIFGDDLGDLDVVSAFQFYMSKNVAVPFTVYIDNVRVLIPEPGTGVMAAAGVSLFGLGTRRTRGHRRLSRTGEAGRDITEKH
jgi:hypothetical protein